MPASLTFHSPNPIHPNPISPLNPSPILSTNRYRSYMSKNLLWLEGVVEKESYNWKNNKNPLVDKKSNKSRFSLKDIQKRRHNERIMQEESIHQLEKLSTSLLYSAVQATLYYKLPIPPITPDSTSFNITTVTYCLSKKIRFPLTRKMFNCSKNTTLMV
jgi:hypothetical protein